MIIDRKWRRVRVGVPRRWRVPVSLLALAVVVLAVHRGSAEASSPPQIASLIQQGEKLTGSGEEGEGELGFSVALSADGDTALIGGPGDDDHTGAVWVFVRSGSTWMQQGPKLTASGEQGGEDEEPCEDEAGEESGVCGFGRSVALSADGNTALIGGPYGDHNRGAVWVFVRSGSTWTQQGAELTGGEESGYGHFGRSVALSADGSTALIGGGEDQRGRGAAWVFTRLGSTWIQQGSKLTGGDEESGDGFFGVSVALSADGDTALIGAPGDSRYLGAVWMFTRSGSTWTQQGEKLTGAGEEGGEGRFGFSVALSGEGETALVGGRSDHEGAGAAWVFTRSDSAWTQQGAKLTAVGEESAKGEVGFSVALSADGDTALVGAPRNDGYAGAAWVFTRSGSVWAGQGARVTGRGEIDIGEFGYGVALDSTGETAMIGGFRDNHKVGAAWVFADQLPLGSSEPETLPNVNGEDPQSANGGSADAGAGAGATTGGTAHGGVLAFGPFTTGTCKVSLPHRNIRVRSHGRAVVELRTGAGACRGRLTLRARTKTKGGRRSKMRIIGTGRFSIATAKTETKTVIVKVKLNRIGRALLRAGHGRLHASLRILALSPASALAQTASVRLTLPKTRKSTKPKG
jgi:hypothetical protein